MTPKPDSNQELDRQRDEIETAFRRGWQSYDDGEPRILTEREYVAAHRVLDLGGWTGLPSATVRAVRDGAQPGDAVPPLPARPYIDDVTDAEVTITGNSPERRVAVLFCHQHFPGVRFGHRFFGYDPALERIELKEKIETGALHRMMRNPPAPDQAGITWTNWED